LEEIQRFLGGLEVGERVAWLATSVVTQPITHDAAVARVGAPIEEFHALQGDVIRTSAAFQLGSRIEEGSYMVASSSCDLVKGRRGAALLFPVQARRRADFPTEKALNAEVELLTQYRSKKYFYLPALEDDEADVVFNVAHLDPLATASNEAVNLAQRRASLTLVGWRIFGTLARALLIREAEGEDRMRPDSPATA
jgi:hypothetical protein